MKQSIQASSRDTVLSKTRQTHDRIIYVHIVTIYSLLAFPFLVELMHFVSEDFTFGGVDVPGV